MERKKPRLHFFFEERKGQFFRILKPLLEHCLREEVVTFGSVLEIEEQIDIDDCMASHVILFLETKHVPSLNKIRVQLDKCFSGVPVTWIFAEVESKDYDDCTWFVYSKPGQCCVHMDGNLEAENVVDSLIRSIKRKGDYRSEARAFLWGREVHNLDLIFRKARKEGNTYARELAQEEYTRRKLVVPSKVQGWAEDPEIPNGLMNRD